MEDQNVTPEKSVETPQATFIDTAASTKGNKIVYVIMGGLLTIFLIVIVFLIWKNEQLKREIAVLQTKPTPTITATVNDTPEPTAEVTEPPVAEPTSEPIEIPNDWVINAGTDTQMGLTVSIYLPTDYSFDFTGSEWNLMNSELQDYWDYTSSVKFDDEGNPVNTYTGGSRRVWFQEYLAGDYSNNVPKTKMGDLISVTEHTAGNISYMEVVVKMAGNNYSETQYLFVENNIVHIIRPYSDYARSGESIVPDNITVIFSSLDSSFE